MSKYDDFGVELLDLYGSCLSRDGSEAFDSLASIHQYYLLYSLFELYVPIGSEVLDWGAGSGHFTYFLIRSGYNSTSFGFNNPGLFENQATNLKLNFIQGNANEPTLLPFSDEKFDAVSSVGVLEHVREFGGSEEGSLREINRILKTGGIFCCYHFPSKYSWIEFLSRAIGRWSHQYRFSKADINQLFPKDLWQILECRQYAVLPRNILGRLLPRYFRKSIIASKIIDEIDFILTILFKPFAQNWLIVAKKR
jgi:ubiquinone/menaquinone biosynthesis C-methylase UbiE